MDDKPVILIFNATYDFPSSTGGKCLLLNKYKRYRYANQAIIDLMRNGYAEYDRIYKIENVIELDGKTYKKVIVESYWSLEYKDVISMIVGD